MKTILYIHGMGGGADSRIPSVLNGWFRKHRRDIRVVVRTYDFHPDRAAEQIRAWYEELQPALVIGESLGANHALALQPRVPLLLVSPALNAPRFLYAPTTPSRFTADGFPAAGPPRCEGAENLTPPGECSLAAQRPRSPRMPFRPCCWSPPP